MAMPTARNTGLGQSTLSGSRGFLGFLLSNPLLLLSAGLGIALLLTGLALKGYKSRYEYWHGQYEQLYAMSAAFRKQVEVEGEKAKAESAAKEKRQQEVNRALEKQVKDADALLAAANRRLRERPPLRPDGSEVSRAACVPEGAVGEGKEPGQWVSLSDYRSLEERAARDVQTLRLVEQWITQQGLRVE